MDVLDRYRRFLGASGYAPNTVRVKLVVVEAVARSAGVEPDQLTGDHVEAYLDRPLAVWTRIKYLGHIKDFAKWADIPDPTAGIRKPHQPRGVPRPVSESTLAAVLAAATPRTRTWVILGAFAGLRSFEIAKVEADDLEVTADGHALRVRGKGGRVDLVPVPRLVAAALAPWQALHPAGTLWPGVDATAVQAAVKRVGRRAGVPLTCHQLRHRYGTQLYAQSRDLLLVQQLMRHADPATTAGYAKLANRAGAQLVELLPLPLTA